MQIRGVKLGTSSNFSRPTYILIKAHQGVTFHSNKNEMSLPLIKIEIFSIRQAASFKIRRGCNDLKVAVYKSPFGEVCSGRGHKKH